MGQLPWNRHKKNLSKNNIGVNEKKNLCVNNKKIMVTHIKI